MLGNLKLQRDNNFDAIRLVLAAMVIVSHSFALTAGSGSHEPLLAGTHGQATLGGVAVYGFFILSGYLVTHSWIATDGLSSYVAKRVCRIVPGFVAATLLGALFIAPLASHMSYWNTISASDIALALVRLVEAPGVAFPSLPYTDFNGSLWTIHFEVECYAILALLGLVRLLRRPWVLGACVMGGIGFSIIPIGFGRSDPPYFQHMHHLASFSSCFFTGSFCYQWGSRIKVTWPLLVVAAGVGLVTALLPPPLFLIALPLSGTYLLLSLGLYTPPVLTKWLARFDLSYGTYLYGWFVSQLLLTVTGASLSSWILAATSVPLTMVVAVPSWLLVEQPFIRMKHSSRAFLVTLVRGGDGMHTIRPGGARALHHLVGVQPNRDRGKSDALEGNHDGAKNSAEREKLLAPSRTWPVGTSDAPTCRSESVDDDRVALVDDVPREHS